MKQIFLIGINHSKISAIADCDDQWEKWMSGINHSKISAIADGDVRVPQHARV